MERRERRERRDRDEDSSKGKDREEEKEKQAIKVRQNFAFLGHQDQGPNSWLWLPLNSALTIIIFYFCASAEFLR